LLIKFYVYLPQTFLVKVGLTTQSIDRDEKIKHLTMAGVKSHRAEPEKPIE
jgi:hypothetical protein